MAVIESYTNQNQNKHYDKTRTKDPPNNSLPGKTRRAFGVNTMNTSTLPKPLQRKLVFGDPQQIAALRAWEEEKRDAEDLEEAMAWMPDTQVIVSKTLLDQIELEVDELGDALDELADLDEFDDFKADAVASSGRAQKILSKIQQLENV